MSIYLIFFLCPSKRQSCLKIMKARLNSQLTRNYGEPERERESYSPVNMTWTYDIPIHAISGDIPNMIDIILVQMTIRIGSHDIGKREHFKLAKHLLTAAIVAIDASRKITSLPKFQHCRQSANCLDAYILSEVW